MSFGGDFWMKIRKTKLDHIIKNTKERGGDGLKHLSYIHMYGLFLKAWFMTAHCLHVTNLLCYHYKCRRHVKALQMILKLDDGRNNRPQPIVRAASHRVFKHGESNKSWVAKNEKCCLWCQEGKRVECSEYCMTHYYRRLVKGSRQC